MVQNSHVILGTGNEAHLINMDTSVLRALIHFIYCGSLPSNLSPVLLHELHDLSLQFNLDRLGALCETLTGGSAVVEPANLAKDFGKLMRDSALADATIVTESGSIRCHRAVLCARSKHLRSQFATLTTSKAHLVLPQSLPTVHALLEFLYTDHVNVTREIAEPLLSLAAQYGLPRY